MATAKPLLRPASSIVEALGLEHWLMYLTYGQDSELSEGEREAIDAWLDRHRPEGGTVASVSVEYDRATGEPLGPWFTWSLDVLVPEAKAKGGNVLRYVIVWTQATLVEYHDSQSGCV